MKRIILGVISVASIVAISTFATSSSIRRCVSQTGSIDVAAKVNVAHANGGPAFSRFYGEVDVVPLNDDAQEVAVKLQRGDLVEIEGTQSYSQIFVRRMQVVGKCS